MSDVAVTITRVSRMVGAGPRRPVRRCSRPFADGGDSSGLPAYRDGCLVRVSGPPRLESRSVLAFLIQTSTNLLPPGNGRRGFRPVYFTGRQVDDDAKTHISPLFISLT